MTIKEVINELLEFHTYKEVFVDSRYGSPVAIESISRDSDGDARVNIELDEEE